MVSRQNNSRKGYTPAVCVTLAGAGAVAGGLSDVGSGAGAWTIEVVGVLITAALVLS